MRWIRNFTVVLILTWVVGACLKQPENSIVPFINYQSVVFKKGNLTTGIKDSIIVKVKFSDGDGDLGINQDETAIYTSSEDSTDINSPYYFVYDSAKNTVWYYTHSNHLALPKGYHYVNYASHRNIHTHPFDTLPSMLTCKSWEVRNLNPFPIDTLYKQDNPYNNNFYMDLYTKNSDGTYTYVDPTSFFSFGNCVPNFFNGRFPVLSSDMGKKSSLDGTITYNFGSSGVYLYFHDKTVKLKIYILDRAFHKSNLTESDDFVIK